MNQLEKQATEEVTLGSRKVYSNFLTFWRLNDNLINEMSYESLMNKSLLIGLFNVKFNWLSCWHRKYRQMLETTGFCQDA